jgi:carboxypeptidase Q
MRHVLHCAVLMFCVLPLSAQTFPVDDPVVRKIWVEAMDSSRIPVLAHQILDVVGPRLVGTPGMLKAQQWAIDTYKGWGITAQNEQYGTWRGWERGVSHIDLLQPRVRSLDGTMLAFCPPTPEKGTTATLSLIPDVKDSAGFYAWLPTVKGTFVMLSACQPTGRPDKAWEEFATKESFDSLKSLRKRIEAEWDVRLKSSGVKTDSLIQILEQAGAAGIITSQWTTGWGTYRIFDTHTKKIPAVTLSLEDYSLLYRLAAAGDRPLVRIMASSRFLETQPANNTIATMPGAEKGDEYVILSAHLDSWDGASGATDNGTGTLIMMEAMRILKKVYVTPRRTILAGHWGSEEQGLNGSRAYALDHPAIVEKLQALFNQDNGTGRITSMGAAGLVNAGDHLARWLSRIPTEITRDMKVQFPGMPAGGGTDNASFAPAGAPAFGLGAINWDYFSYTWHTNRDTYDKLVFDELKNNAALVACLVYLACEDPAFISRERRVMPADKNTGAPQTWPAGSVPNRDGTPRPRTRE